MKWKPGSNALTFNERDLRIMAQCRMRISELYRQHRPNPRIPPLWSVLSYVMLHYGSGDTRLWRRYRTLTEIARNPAACYYRRWIPKANGELRPLSVPDARIQDQQRFILTRILRELPVDSHACAYRKGVGIRDCAQPHQNRDVLIHLDIRDFFGSITEDMVYEMLLRETGYEKSLCRFLARMCTLKDRLPQGGVTSPALSNLVFRHCDEALAELAEWYGMAYTRYSDDLFFSGNEPVQVDAFLKEAAEVLEKSGFRLNRDKTRVRRRQHRQAVLGMTVNQNLQVNRTYRRRLMQELYYVERFGSECNGAVEMGNYLRYLQKLQGKLSYVIQADPDNIRLRTAQLMLAEKILEFESIWDVEYW